MLTIADLRVSYGPVRALSGLAIHVEQGELVALVGSNGAGKTSLLNTIAGAQSGSRGSIRFLGTEIRGMRPEKILRLGIGYVPEGRQIFSTMSVLDNLLLGTYSKGPHGLLDLIRPLRGYQAHTHINVKLEQVYALFPILRERTTQQAGSLSGGEQQMLAIARALMSEPKLLLLDEPSLGLAPVVTKEIMRLLQRLRDGGLTVLLVEQNANAALQIADRGYVLENGGVYIEGTAADLLTNDAIRQAYLGEGPVSDAGKLRSERNARDVRPVTLDDI